MSLMINPLRPPGEAPLIQDGDLVIAYESFNSMKALTVKTDGQYHNKYGVFMMNVRTVYIACMNSSCFCTSRRLRRRRRRRQRQ